MTDPAHTPASPSDEAQELARLRHENRRLRAKLRLRSRVLRLAVGGNRTALWYLDLAKQEMQWSYVGDSATQNTRGKAPLALFVQAIHPEDQAKFNADLEACLQGGTYQSEYRIWATEFNRFIYARVTGHAEYFADGRPRGILAIMLDTLPELELTREKEQYQAKISIALSDRSTTLWAQDEKLTYLWLENPQLPEPIRDIIGLSDYDFPAEVRNASLLAAKEQVITTRQEVLWEGWLQAPSNMPHYTRLVMRPYVLPNGLLGLIGKSIDLTNTVKADAEVLMERSLLKLGLGVGKMAAFVQDSQLRYIWVYDPIAGFAGDAIIGKTDWELALDMPGLEKIYGWKKDVLAKSETITRDYWITRGETKAFVRHIGEPYRLPDGTSGLLGIAIDITELKHQETELYERGRNLEKEKARTQTLLAEREQELAAKRTELAQAAQLQLSMQPKRDLNLPGWELATKMEASEEVGGDYLDYMPMPDGSFILALGDATGHGMRSGIMVASVKSFFQCLAPTLPPAPLLDALHKHILDMELPQMFMGLTVMHIRQGQVEAAFAGMPPLFVYRAATGAVERVVRPGIFLGTHLHRPYQPVEFEVAAGDVIVIASDGLLEAFSPAGKMLGEEPVCATLAAHAQRPVSDILSALRDLRHTHTAGAPLHDDMTLAVVRVR